MILCLAQRDIAIHAAIQVQAGLLTEEAWSIAVLAAAFCGDTETPPQVIKSAAESRGLSMTLLVAPGNTIPEQVMDHVLGGKVAFAWLKSPIRDGGRFWCHLHTHDGATIAGAYYSNESLPYAECRRVGRMTTGHYLLVDQVFVPADAAYMVVSGQ